MTSGADAAAARRAALERGLDGLGCAALAVVAASAYDPDLAPWAGAAHVGRAVLALPREGAPRLAYATPMERDEAAATGLPLVAPEALGLPELARNGAGEDAELAVKLRGALGAAGIAPGRVALTGRVSAGILHAACRVLEAEGWRFVPGEQLGRLLRKPKSAADLAAIRRAADGAVAALRRVAGLLAAAVPAHERGGALVAGGAPLTAGRLRGEAAAELSARGLSMPEGSIVAAGAEGAVPHNRGDDIRRIAPGESVVVDLFPRGALFADCTRTFCAGPPSPALAAAHAAVCAALDAAAAHAAPGLRAWDLQLVACREIGERGWPTPVSDPGTLRGYVHNLGHGVGHELHELPSFRKESGIEGMLDAGDVFTLEPGIYEPEAGWAVRVEDLWFLGAAGLERLTGLPRDLDPRAYGPA